MNICVVGTGYVGLVTGTCFAEFGVHVTCVDSDAEKIAGLCRGQVPIYEPGLEFLIEKNVREGRLHFTTDIVKGVTGSLVVFIAVGTPASDDGQLDLKYVEAAARGIGQQMDGYKVIATKSTVPAGTGQWIGEVIRANLKEPCNFDVVSNPEFLREGSAVEDFMHPDRIVIGAVSDQAIAIMKDLYRPLYLIETPIIITSVETAEMIKYASNAFLATKISFINEVALLCEKVGADVHHVAKAMGLDKRIGPKFLHPGPGYGGSCFPKDTQGFVQLGSRHGLDLKIVKAVVEVNERQKLAMVDKIRAAAGGSLSGKTIGVCGLAFKPNTDDMRDAPSLVILPALQKEGARIRAFDPAAMPASQRLFRDVTYCDDLMHVAADSDVLVLMTEWNQFRSQDLRELHKAMRDPVVVDLRNVYDPVRMRDLGFRYYSVGRP
ncbi:MAG: UDP-glucose/GDP-mannose dehydrogenase family protein [Candidatus Wallbacteria bacterium]|nr:UDP-glucose/GDP-mannose dehydrogenase family protein [Candidatus Wallbacteria bacterium]